MLTPTGVFVFEPDTNEVAQSSSSSSSQSSSGSTIVAPAVMPKGDHLENLDRASLSIVDLQMQLSFLTSTSDWEQQETVVNYCKVMRYIALHLDFSTFKTLWNSYCKTISEKYRYQPLALSIAGYDGWPHASHLPDAFRMYQYIEESDNGGQHITDILLHSSLPPAGTLMAFCQNHLTENWRNLALPASVSKKISTPGPKNTYGLIATLVEIAQEKNQKSAPVLWVFIMDTLLMRYAKDAKHRHYDYDPSSADAPTNPSFRVLADMVVLLLEKFQELKKGDTQITFADIQKTFQPYTLRKEAQPWLALALQDESAFRFGCQHYHECMIDAQHVEQTYERSHALLALKYNLKSDGLYLWQSLESAILSERDKKTQDRLEIRLALLLASLAHRPETECFSTLSTYSSYFQSTEMLQRIMGTFSNKEKSLVNASVPHAVATLYAQLMRWVRALPGVAHELFTTRYNELIGNDDDYSNLYINILLGCDLILETMSFILLQPNYLHSLNLCQKLFVIFPDRIIKEELQLISQSLPEAGITLTHEQTQESERITRNLKKILSFLKVFWESVRGPDQNYLNHARYFIELFRYIDASLRKGEAADADTYPQPMANSFAQMKYFEFMAFSHLYAHKFNQANFSVSFLLDYIEIYQEPNPLAQHLKIHALLCKTKMRSAQTKSALSPELSSVPMQQPQPVVSTGASSLFSSPSSPSFPSFPSFPSSPHASFTAPHYSRYPQTPTKTPMRPTRLRYDDANNADDSDSDTDSTFSTPRTPKAIATTSPTATPPASRIRELLQPAAYAAMLHYSAILVLLSARPIVGTGTRTESSLSSSALSTPLTGLTSLKADELKSLLSDMEHTLTIFANTTAASPLAIVRNENAYQRYYVGLLTPLLIDAESKPHILLASCQIILDKLLATIVDPDESDHAFIEIVQLTHHCAQEIFSVYEGSIDLQQIGSFLRVFCSVIDFNYQLRQGNPQATQIWQQLCDQSLYEFSALETCFMDFLTKSEVLGFMRIKEFKPDELKLIRAYLSVLVQQSALSVEPQMAEQFAQLVRSVPTTPQHGAAAMPTVLHTM